MFVFFMYFSSLFSLSSLLFLEVLIDFSCLFIFDNQSVNFLHGPSSIFKAESIFF